MENENILSAREWEIAEIIAKGATKKEVANKLFISVRTVETHTKNIYQKTKARTPNGLSAWWFCKKFNLSIELSEFQRTALAIFFVALLIPQVFTYESEIRKPKRLRTTIVCRAKRNDFVN